MQYYTANIDFEILQTKKAEPVMSTAFFVLFVYPDLCKLFICLIPVSQAD